MPLPVRGGVSFGLGPIVGSTVLSIASWPWLFAINLPIGGYAAQTMTLIALPFFIQDALHRSQFGIGLLLTPWPLVVACVARLSGKMADRHPVGLLAGAGLAVMCVGLGLLAAMPADASPLNILWRVILCGLGFGFFQTPKR